MVQDKSANKLAWLVLVIGTALPLATGQTGVARNAVSAHHVAAAMELAGVAVNPNQIEFLSGASSIGESAQMRVVSVTNRTNGTVRVKLRCRDNHECLPFYVLVHGIDGGKVDRPEERAVPAVVAGSPKNVIRGGDHAILILESHDSRMSLPVICLQGGARGQTIRVASPDRRQIFDAEIVATGMLRGTL
jgi:flagella basal body P-ring formation protein FlgA